MKRKTHLLFALCTCFLTVGIFNGIHSNLKSAKADSLLSFSDEELENYDVVTLRDVGLGEEFKVESEAVNSVDYLYASDASHSIYYPSSTSNTTFSTVLEFVYNAPSSYQPKDLDRDSFDFRIGSKTAWEGYKFSFKPNLGNGYIYIGINDAVKDSREFAVSKDEDHLFQYGAVHIKNSNDVWLFAKIDGELAASARVTNVSNYTYPIANFYAFPSKEGTFLSFKSTGNAYEYKNSFTVNDDPIYFQTNGASGLYYKLDNPNNIPFSNWDYRSVPLTNFEVLINGNPVANPRTCILNHYSSLEYYVAFSDSGITPKANDEIVVSGYFKTVIESAKKAYVFRINEIVVTFDGTKYIQQPSLYDKFTSQLNSYVDIELYNEDGISQINAILNTFGEEMNNAVISYQYYGIYEKAVTAIDAVEFDESIAAAKLAEAKSTAIEEINNYVSLDDYLLEQIQQIQSIITEATSKINSATNRKEVSSILVEYERKIDLVRTKVSYGEEAILNQIEGYEDYLEEYDVVSLSDVNLKDTEYIRAYHVKDNMPDNGNPSNDSSENVLNTFVNSPNNPNGNLIFQFKYHNTTNVAGKYGASMFIRLRGIRYFGYRFCLGKENGGVEIDRMQGDGSLCTVLGNKDNVFETNVTYEVKLIAIDVKNSNDVWLALSVNDEIVMNYITEKISFCTTTRVGISDSHLPDNSTDVITLTNMPEGTTCSSNYVNVGRAKLNAEETSSCNGVYITLANGNIPFDSNWQLSSYPTSSSAITLNDEPICVNNVTALKKYGPTSYYIALADFGVTAEVGDTLVIDGSFTCADGDSPKVGYTVKRTTFVYRGSEGWQYIASLEDTKEDAIFELENYFVSDAYSEVNIARINEIVETAITNINAALDFNEVNEILAKAKEDIDDIYTILDEYVLNLANEIDEYMLDDYDLYRDEQVSEINRLKSEAKIAILYVKNQAEADAIFAKLKADIALVKTDAELFAEELEDAKSSAKKELRTFYSKLDISSYSDDIVSQINAIVVDAMDKIDSSLSIESINNLVNEAEDAINELITPKKEEKGCKGSIIATSGVISLLSLLGIGMGMLKRKEN